MQKVWKVILSISLVANIGFGIIVFKPEHKEELDPREYTSKIDSLGSVISSISNKRDSIREVIDTVYADLSKTEKEYEEVRDIIISNSTSDDYIFFTEYLERNRERLDSINNLKSTQGN